LPAQLLGLPAASGLLQTTISPPLVAAVGAVAGL
jgi:hypothetical protein